MELDRAGGGRRAAAARPRGGRRAGRAAVTRAVQDEVHPYDRNYFRSGDALSASSRRLEALWRAVRDGLVGGDDPTAALRAREAAAMVAHARWMYAAATARTESRGMHRRVDRPERDLRLQQRLLVGGLDELWTRPDPVRPRTSTPVGA